MESEGCRDGDFTEEPDNDKNMGWRSDSEETVDTVVVVMGSNKDQDSRMKSRNSDYSSYCNSPSDLAETVRAEDISNDGDNLQNSPLLPTSDEEDTPVKLDMPPVTPSDE